MTKDEALKLALKFVEDSECGTADLEAHIKEALAQPEQEPTAYCYVKKTTSADALTFNPDPANAVDNTVFPLYTHPQRTWQGLTEDEANLLWENTDDRDSWELIKRVEAKLKERNNG